MRVLLDAYWWVSGPDSLRNVVQAQVRTWMRVFPQDDVHLLVKRSDEAAVRADLGDAVTTWGTRLFPQGVAGMAAAPRAARRAGVDAYLTHNYAGADGRGCVFVHDFLFQRHPEWFTRAERAYFGIMPLVVGRARGAVFTTEVERDAAVRRNSRMRATTIAPLGPPLGQLHTEPDPVTAVEHLAAFDLTVGRLNARKNLGATLGAASLAASITPDHPLLVVGQPDGKAADLSDEVRRAERTGEVLFLDRVSDAQLLWLYQRADRFVFLSQGEGFGLPPLEALHFGSADVLVNDLPVFREVLGDRATFVDGTDPAAVAAALDAPRGPRRTGPGRADVEGLWEQHVRALRAELLRRS